MERWKQKDIALMAGWLGDAYRKAGILPDGAQVYIRTGSPSGGYAWRLSTDNGYDIPGVRDYLGWSGSEARAVCRAYLDTLQALDSVGSDWHTTQCAGITEGIAARQVSA